MGTEDYKAGWREVYLPPTYGTPSWTVVVSESRSTVYSQVEWFAYYLPVAVVSGLSFVLLLASVVVRRTMDPLERLTEGTRRIAEQDFGTRVDVESKDEFGELARSFNTMAERLGLQFREIKAGTAIDRAVLSASGREVAMRAVLDGVADVVPSAHRAVLLLEPGSSVEGSLYSVSPSDDGVVESTCSLDEADRAWLYGDNMHVLASNGIEARGLAYCDLLSLRERGQRRCAVLSRMGILIGAALQHRGVLVRVGGGTCGYAEERISPVTDVRNLAPVEHVADDVLFTYGLVRGREPVEPNDGCVFNGDDL